jgi:hypothetical protein
MADVVNGDVPVANGEKAEREMVNKNEERQDEHLIVDSCDEESSDDELDLIERV